MSKKEEMKDSKIVDLSVMLNEPIPFAKFGADTYGIKPLTIAETRKYGNVLIHVPVYALNLDDAREALIECFDSHVFDGKGNPVKFEDIQDKWPDEAISIFVKAILKISG